MPKQWMCCAPRLPNKPKFRPLKGAISIPHEGVRHMSLRLILMRHAKSNWKLPGPDHNRDLNKRGVASAKAMGNWLKERNFIPHEALISTSKRTRKTFETLSINTKRKVFLKELYHPSVHTLMKVLSNAHEQTVLLVSHNPAIAEFAKALAEAAPSHERFRDYPTCSTWVAEFDIRSWEEVRFGTGHTLDFGIPREVMNTANCSC